MPQYVILEHDWPRRHWDLMLEAGDVLRTWRLSKTPQPGQEVVATPLGDHRRAYLEYEGPLSGNRGQVSRWDSGTFAWELHDPDHLRVTLTGRRLQGVADLRRDIDEKWSFRLEESLAGPGTA